VVRAPPQRRQQGVGLGVGRPPVGGLRAPWRQRTIAMEVRGWPAAPWSSRPGRRGRAEEPVDSGDGGAGRKKAGQGLAARRGAGPAAGRGPGSQARWTAAGMAPWPAKVWENAASPALVRRGPARDGEGGGGGRAPACSVEPYRRRDPCGDDRHPRWEADGARGAGRRW
jgi:hypothetical protein